MPDLKSGTVFSCFISVMYDIIPVRRKVAFIKPKKIITIVPAILIVSFVAYGIYNSLFSDTSDYNEKIVSGFYDCEENEKVVPGDAICYSEYYYENDIASQIEENYTAVTDDNIDVVKQFTERFKDKFLYDTDKGKKDFIEKLNTGDYYFMDTGCSSELNENHFRLYYYDSESFTIYYMWRCQ